MACAVLGSSCSGAGQDPQDGAPCLNPTRAPSPSPAPLPHPHSHLRLPVLPPPLTLPFLQDQQLLGGPAGIIVHTSWGPSCTSPPALGRLPPQPPSLGQRHQQARDSLPCPSRSPHPALPRPTVALHSSPEGPQSLGLASDMMQQRGVPPLEATAPGQVPCPSVWALRHWPTEPGNPRPCQNLPGGPVLTPCTCPGHQAMLSQGGGQLPPASCPPPHSGPPSTLFLPSSKNQFEGHPWGPPAMPCSSPLPTLGSALVARAPRGPECLLWEPKWG